MPGPVLARCAGRGELAQVPLSMHLDRARLVVVSQTVANLDGIAYQCPSVVCLTPETANYHPMPGEATVQFVADPARLGRIAAEILAAARNPHSDREYAAVLARLCDFPAAAAEYLDRIELALAARARAMTSDRPTFGYGRIRGV